MKTLLTSAFAAGLLTAAAASASSYTYTTIAVPGAAMTFVENLNNHGTVVGEYLPVGGSFTAYHGFVFSNGQYQTIDPPGSTDTIIAGISDDGTIFGSFVAAPSNAFFAFSYKAGRYKVLGSDQTHTGFNVVSENGLAYGFSIDLTTNEERLFSQKNLKTRTLGITAASCDFAGVNDYGVSTGTCSPPFERSTRPFVGQPGGYSKIVIPNGAAIRPSAINNGGTVVGYFLDTQTVASRGYDRPGLGHHGRERSEPQEDDPLRGE